MTNIKEKNSEIYKKEIQQSLEEVEDILSDLEINDWVEVEDFNRLFNRSSRDIISSWTSGRKYSRTVFAKKAFGDTFPDDLMVFSLSVDVMINILDDFLDENLTNTRKENYVIEFLRNFSIYNHMDIPEELRDSVGLYLNKLITLALSENIYENNLKNEEDLEKIASASVELLKCRGMDMDIFAEIALINHKENNEEIKKLFRIFRALNIFKKDILDISYDRDNGIKTVVIIALDKNFEFDEYTNLIIKNLEESSNNTLKEIDDPVADKIGGMIKREGGEVKKIIKSL